MIKMSIKELTAGMVTATPIYSKTGQRLFPANTVLTSQQISYLEFYGVLWVQILPEDEIDEPSTEVPESVLSGSNLPEPEPDTESYSQKIRRSRKFHTFKVDFSKKTEALKDSFSHLIDKTEFLDSDVLLDQVSSLYSNHLTSLSVFDMLHNMRQIDDTTYAHCINVSIISRILGGWLEYSEKDLDLLTLAGLLHDIGKCQIDPQILTKPGPLSPEEYNEIKRHPILGAAILADYPLDDQVRSAVLMHHERCDGSGYPSGLHKDEISEFAKIVAIADVYDAMTSSRCYRKGICPFEVIATFERIGFERYDSKYLLPFLTRIIDTYIGNTVLLNDGSTGKVILVNRQALSRPVVSTATNKYLDLTKHPELYIQSII